MSRKVRIVLYLDPPLVEALEDSARRREAQSGVRVTPEGEARIQLARLLLGGDPIALETAARALEAARGAGATPEVLAALKTMPLVGGLDLASLIVFERADAARGARKKDGGTDDQT